MKTFNTEGAEELYVDKATMEKSKKVKPLNVAAFFVFAFGVYFFDSIGADALALWSAVAFGRVWSTF